jgi:HTH-type transcriptional regulator/antitoxin HigA
MDIRALHNDADYAWALGEIARYFDKEPEPGTAEGDRFDVLATLIEAYEARRFAIPDGDPVDVLHFAIEHLGRSQSHLAQILGSRSRASEVLNRRRPLTLDMIRSISAEWKLPLAALAKPYEIDARRYG